MLQHYVEILQNDFGDKRLIACEMVKPLDKQKQEKLRQQENWDQIQLKIQEYGTGFWDPSSLEDSENITTNHIVLNNYTSKYDKTSSINPFYKSNQQQIKEQKMEENKSNTSQNVGFLSTINFIEDLIQISEDLKFAEPKVVSLRSELQKLNQHLPANSIRNHVILNIVAKEAKVFSTKERAPFYICVELFRPEEESEKNLQDSLVTKIESKMRQQKQDVKIWSYDLKLSQPLTALVKKNPLTKQERLYGSDDQSFNQLVQESRSFKQAQQQKSAQVLLKPSIQKNESYKNKNDKKNKKNRTKIDNDIKEPLLTKETDDDDLSDSQNQLEQPQNTQQSRQINLNPKEAQINQNQERSDQDTNGEKTQNGLSNEQIEQHKEQISKTFVDQNQHNQDQNNFRTLSFQVSGENGRSTIINRQKSTTIGTAYFYDREIQQKVQEEHELEENKQGEEEYINHDEIQIIEEEDEPQSRDQKNKSQKLSNQENASNLKNNSKIKAGQKSKDASFIAEQFVNQYRIKKQITIQSHDNQKIDKNSMQYQIFGEDLEEQEKRIRQQSIYGHFKSWKLIHLIIKTGDNLKQEQFAQQLIYQFQQIFELEKTDLLLRPYEILSVGPGEGLMETVKNSVTFDSLHKTLQTNYKNITDLDVFFRQFYGENFGKARENFLNSLAAYSLVCYFLQVKDRHNGNILLHKDGYLVHIDFGFFFSNAPGQGLAFEKNVPFKMLQDYIVILGGTKSYSFQRFRRKFHKGFMAAKRHQDKIMILAKMMFSGHGSTLPCFEAGEQAIKDLEQRFNPPGIQTEQQLYNHTQQYMNLFENNV
ncbi:Protein kinase-like domain [Pseudocohnilembus persalinus]|uniref:Protein kinase-like domain n=1 Tax=Pseudocohnilembus persalinus TaxID=266149 RepID=A0A0V0QZD8_PSEPJ|nr:Protein kinase-like domain [Pseudocohnilembus persalinus]|eukprot:KRX07569.1 Protein kinase-like domain [Pseudocohnilembus persalinus]